MYLLMGINIFNFYWQCVLPHHVWSQLDNVSLSPSLFIYFSLMVDPLVIINLNLWDQKKNTIFVYCWHLSIRSFRKERLGRLYFVLDSEFQTLVLMNNFHDSYTSGHHHWSIFGFIFLHLCLYLLPINSLILW